MFQLTDLPIDPKEMRAGLDDRRSGALATFEGWVRDHNEGKQVIALEYQAYAELAAKEGELILAEAVARFDVHAARCVHRTGALVIGDTAVWVGVTASHRADAFDACQYIIDEIKRRVPIWKREQYADGSVEWVNCAHGSASTTDGAGSECLSGGRTREHAH